jgi:selenophosphate synthase
MRDRRVGWLKRYASRRADMEKLWGEYFLDVVVPEATYRTFSEVLRRAKEDADSLASKLELKVQSAKRVALMRRFPEGSTELENEIAEWLALIDFMRDFEYILDKYIR